MSQDSNVFDYIVVGAGIAGVYSAFLIDQFSQAQQTPVSLLLLEKSRGVGGRVATKRLEVGVKTHTCELGAFALNEPLRSAVLQMALDEYKGDGDPLAPLVHLAPEPRLARWNDLCVFEGFANDYLKELLNYIGQEKLQTQSKVTALHFKETLQQWCVTCEVSETDFNGQARVSDRVITTKKLVLAMPAPQAYELLKQAQGIGVFPLQTLQSVDMACRWIFVCLVQGTKPSRSLFCLEDHAMIETVAVLSQKPGMIELDGLHLLQVSMTLEWSQQHQNLTKTQMMALHGATVLQQLSDQIGTQVIAEAKNVQAHKWLYSQVKKPLDTGYLANERWDLWVLGDWASGYGIDDSLLSSEVFVRALISEA